LRAVEAALQIDPPPRAKVLRGVMAELERIANHLGDIGAICNDASFSIIHAHCGIFRERVLAAADRAFGHRLMMDRIVPGGVEDAAPGAARGLQVMLDEIERPFAEIVRLYDDTPSLQDAPAPRVLSARAWLTSGRPAAMSAAPRAGTSIAAAIFPTRRMTRPPSRCRCSPQATSTPASGAHPRGRAEHRVVAGIGSATCRRGPARLRAPGWLGRGHCHDRGVRGRSCWFRCGIEGRPHRARACAR
jgi:hypothetical protein